MPDSPFSESFDEGKFYTQSSDKHHHSERANFRVPGEWLHFASIVANSPLCPEYETVSDIFRDSLAKGIAIALQRVNDSNAIAAWSLQLSKAELEQQEAKDATERDTVELWRSRLATGYSYDVANFRRDRALMTSPDCIREMESLASRYNLS